MIYVVAEDTKQNVFHIMDVETKSKEEAKTLPAFKHEDLIITCGQIFVTKAAIHDVTLVEKMIYFPGPKTIARLQQKYFLKISHLTKFDSLLNMILRVYKAQLKEIREQRLERAVEFETSITGTLAYINSKKITIKDSFLKSHEDRRDSFSKKRTMSRTEIIEECVKNKYNFFDKSKGQWDLSKKNLLSVDNKRFKDHLEASFENEILRYEKQYYQKHLPINHNQFGAITGRITTTSPNIQGIQKKWIEGNIYSFDYTGFEVMIFLNLYNPFIIKEYEKSGQEDLYMFLFDKLTDNRSKPELRDDLKYLLIKIIYGAEERTCIKDYGKFGEYMYPRIVKMFDIKKIKDDLIAHILRMGRYLIVPNINYTIRDKYSYMLFKNAPIAKDLKKKYGSELNTEYWSDDPKTYTSRKTYHDKLTYEKGIVQEAIDTHKTLTRLCLNYHIQGIGAYILKKCMSRLARQIESQILILRHDEFIVDILREKDIEIVQKTMEDVFFSIMKGNINVKTSRINGADFK